MYTQLLVILLTFFIYCSGYIIYKKYTAPLLPSIYYEETPYRPLLQEELLKTGEINYP
jgi:hypothetical protein